MDEAGENLEVGGIGLLRVFVLGKSANKTSSDFIAILLFKRRKRGKTATANVIEDCEMPVVRKCWGADMGKEEKSVSRSYTYCRCVVLLEMGEWKQEEEK